MGASRDIRIISKCGSLIQREGPLLIVQHVRTGLWQKSVFGGRYPDPILSGQSSCCPYTVVVWLVLLVRDWYVSRGAHEHLCFYSCRLCEKGVGVGQLGPKVGPLASTPWVSGKTTPFSGMHVFTEREFGTPEGKPSKCYWHGIRVEHDQFRDQRPRTDVLEGLFKL